MAIVVRRDWRRRTPGRFRYPDAFEGAMTVVVGAEISAATLHQLQRIRRRLYGI